MPPGVKKKRVPQDEPDLYGRHREPCTVRGTSSFFADHTFCVNFCFSFRSELLLSVLHCAHVSGRAFADSSRLSRGTRGKCLFAVSVCVRVFEVGEVECKAQATGADLRTRQPTMLLATDTSRRDDRSFAYPSYFLSFPLFVVCL